MPARQTKEKNRNQSLCKLGGQFSARSRGGWKRRAMFLYRADERMRNGGHFNQ